MPVRVKDGVTLQARLLEQRVQGVGDVDRAEADTRLAVPQFGELVGERDELPRLVAGMLQPEPAACDRYGHSASSRCRARDAVGRRYAA